MNKERIITGIKGVKISLVKVIEEKDRESMSGGILWVSANKLFGSTDIEALRYGFIAALVYLGQSAIWEIILKPTIKRIGAKRSLLG